MKFGVCRALDDFEAMEYAKKAGVDYFEARFGCFVDFDDAKIKESKQALKSLGLPCVASNGFIPGDMKLVGDNVDYGLITEYLDKGFERAAEFGVEKVVFGSGAARSYPDGYSTEKAKEQVSLFLSDYAAPRAAKIGSVIVIEPLSFCETSMIYRVSDGIEIAEMCGCSNVYALADLYHVHSNNDDIEGFSDFKGKIRHCHIAQPKTRQYPLYTDDSEILRIYKSFFKAISSAGCDTCSIEARTTDFNNEIVKAVPFLKSLFI